MNDEGTPDHMQMTLEPTEAPVPAMPRGPAELSPESFEMVSEALAAGGTAAAFDKLADVLTQAGQYARVFDALCLRKRWEMGLPLYAPNLSEVIPPGKRKDYEDFVIDVCRRVANLFLSADDIGGAWPYLRTIGETDVAVKALDAAEPADDKIDVLIDIAWQQQVHPRRGFQWILERYGTCQAITLMDQDVRQPPDVRRDCVAMLVRRLHADLAANLRVEIQRREGAAPTDEDLRALIMGRPWLFEDHGYHIDSSHLSAVVRMALLLSDGPDLRKAVQLADYGTNLSEDWQHGGTPPFEDTYRDCGLYLSALCGQEVEKAVEHFRGKIDPDDRTGSAPYCAQLLVNLLHRLGRHAEALEAFTQHGADADGPPQACPGYVELCLAAGRPDRWAAYAQKHKDLVGYTAALVQEKP